MAEISRNWTIEIIGGPNVGALLHLAPGDYTLGAGAQNDIVLADDALADCAAKLNIGVCDIQVRALHLGTKPGKLLFKSAGPRSRELSLGLTRMRITGPRGARSRTRLTYLRITVAAALCALLPLPLLGHVPNTVPDVVATMVTSSLQTTPGHPMAEQIAFTDNSAIQGGAEALIERLGTDHLQTGLKLTSIAGGVEVTGQIAHDQVPAWLEAKRWFDEHYGTSLVLVDQTTETQKAGGPHLAISAVRSGAVRYVITDQGEKLGEGAVIEGGWTIIDIRSDRVVLSHDDETVEITL